MITDKRASIPWYIEFLLIFKPTYYSTDYGSGADKDITLCVKYLFGKTYVLSEIVADEDELDSSPAS